jgi:hypothetical protein
LRSSTTKNAIPKPEDPIEETPLKIEDKSEERKDHRMEPSNLQKNWMEFFSGNEFQDAIKES